MERARKDAREGKSPSTQAGEFVKEEMDHIREGKHGARSSKQAIAIGLSKARRAGVKLPPPKGTLRRRRRHRPRGTVPKDRIRIARCPQNGRERLVQRSNVKDRALRRIRLCRVKLVQARRSGEQNHGAKLQRKQQLLGRDGAAKQRVMPLLCDGGRTTSRLDRAPRRGHQSRFGNSRLAGDDLKHPSCQCRAYDKIDVLPDTEASTVHAGDKIGLDCGPETQDGGFLLGPGRASERAQSHVHDPVGENGSPISSERQSRCESFARKKTSGNAGKSKNPSACS